MMVMVMVMVMVMGMVMVMVMVMVMMVMVMMVQLMVHQKQQLNGQMNGQLMGQLMGHQKVQLKNQNVLTLGLVTVIVMIKTTILNVILMEVIVVKVMLKKDGITTAKFVSALISQTQQKPLMDPIVQHHIGLVITFVTMKTIIRNVVLMVVIAVEMSTQSIALNADAFNNFTLYILKSVVRF